MSPLPASSWLTAVRLSRLSLVLRRIPSGPPPLPEKDANRVLWAICGGPFEEIRLLIELLKILGLIWSGDEALRRTKGGDKVAKAAKFGDLAPLGLALVRGGCFHDQARVLIESGRISTDGRLECAAKVVRPRAAQLLGLLQWFREVQVHPIVVVPKTVVDELNTVWALIPPPAELPRWAAERKEVGNRAEMYTVQTEKLVVGDPSKIVWVARDSDTLGWDVEDRSVSPHRRIEVKGSRAPEPVLYFSENEWSRVHELKERYEVQFWGEIDLRRPPAVEYPLLRAGGYPLRIPNFASALAGVEWEAAAVGWRVSRAKGTLS